MRSLTSPAPATALSDPLPGAVMVRHGTAFGLRVAGTFPAPGLWTGAESAALRRISLEVAPSVALARSWPEREGEPLLRRSAGAGGPILAVDAHPERGYLVRADGFGAYLIAPDGREAVLAPGPVEGWRWQRLLTAQVLPVAALVQGFELLHASAVRLHGRVLAFTGASGTGKTTLAARMLLASGASFISDDVLALEQVEGDVIAHPGPALMNLRESTPILSADERIRLGVELGRDKATTRLRVHERGCASPLHAIYLLRRSANRTGGIGIERLSRPAPAQLLGAGYGTAVRTPARLIRRLDLCAHLARHTPVFALEASCQAAPGAVAEAVLQHARRSMV